MLEELVTHKEVCKKLGVKERQGYNVKRLNPDLYLGASISVLFPTNNKATAKQILKLAKKMRVQLIAQLKEENEQE